MLNYIEETNIKAIWNFFQVWFNKPKHRQVICSRESRCTYEDLVVERVDNFEAGEPKMLLMDGHVCPAQGADKN